MKRIKSLGFTALASGLIALLGLVGWWKATGGAAKPGNPIPSSIADQSKDGRQSPSTRPRSTSLDYRKSDGSIDTGKLRKAREGLDSRNYPDLFRDIFESNLSDKEKLTFLFGISHRMVTQGHAELVREMFDQYQPAGQLRNQLLMAVYQDPNRNVPTLFEDLKGISSKEERNAALAGISEKMRGKDFKVSELADLPKLETREATAIANGLTGIVAHAANEEEKSKALSDSLNVIGQLQANGRLPETATFNFLASSSLASPFETWELLANSHPSEDSLAAYKQAIAMNAGALVKERAQDGISLIEKDYRSQRIDASGFRAGVVAWIQSDATRAGTWFSKRQFSRDDANMICEEMSRHYSRTGDEAEAAKWDNLIVPPPPSGNQTSGN